jgi:hypothetical protein
MQEFEQVLAQALVAARARVVNRTEVARRAAEAGPVRRPSLSPYGG